MENNKCKYCRALFSEELLVFTPTDSGILYGDLCVSGNHSMQQEMFLMGVIVPVNGVKAEK